jgi:hypothetical protein
MVCFIFGGFVFRLNLSALFFLPPGFIQGFSAPFRFHTGKGIALPRATDLIRRGVKLQFCGNAFSSHDHSPKKQHSRHTPFHHNVPKVLKVSQSTTTPPTNNHRNGYDWEGKP